VAAGGARVPDPDPVHGTAGAAPDPAPGLDLATVDPVPIQGIAPSRGRETKSAALAPAPAPSQTIARGGVPAVPMIKTPRRETWTCRGGNNLFWAGWRGQPVVLLFKDGLTAQLPPLSPSLSPDPNNAAGTKPFIILPIHYIIYPLFEFHS